MSILTRFFSKNKSTDCPIHVQLIFKQIDILKSLIDSPHTAEQVVRLDQLYAPSNSSEISELATIRESLLIASILHYKFVHMCYPGVLDFGPPEHILVVTRSKEMHSDCDAFAKGCATT